MPYKNETLEQSNDPKKPDLEKISKELQEAVADISSYSTKMARSRAWRNCEWQNQTIDGKMWPAYQGQDVFPWPGCSDSRLRIVNTVVQEYVTLCLAAFWASKKQIKSIRPFASGHEVSITQQMLDWRMEAMQRELLAETEFTLEWMFESGLSFLKIEWEQKRELIYVPLTLDMVGELTAALGIGSAVVEQILDPDKAYDKELVTILQQLSQVLPTDEARKILGDLRDTGQAQLPITRLQINKPKWTARRPLLDVIFPSETCDIQVTRFTNERELVDETELTDRIVTDGYDPDFVEELLTHKGVFADWWQPQPNPATSDRNLFELNHFLSWRIHEGAPCLYRTVFNEAVSHATRSEVFALHRKFEYDHGQFPFVAFRRTHRSRPLLSSIGIAEEAYTDEMDIKRQQDGLNNRTDLIHRPPKIIPTTRSQAWSGDQGYGPGATMTATRPDSVQWVPLSPIDQTPIQVMMMVQSRLDRRYPITGGEVDPEIKALHRKHITDKINSTFDLALTQTLQLQWQFESPEDIKEVTGSDPWQYDRAKIQKQTTAGTAIDINNIDIEYAKSRMEMLGSMLPYREYGIVFNAMAQIASPDLADALSKEQASPTAMEKEKDDEYNAMAQILAGMEPRMPLQPMSQLRLQTMQEILADPATMQRVQQDQVAQKRVQNRAKYFQNQIQQFQNNPQIGRTLATQTFNKQQPAVMSAPAQ